MTASSSVLTPEHLQLRREVRRFLEQERRNGSLNNVVSVETIREHLVKGAYLLCFQLVITISQATPSGR